MLLGVFFYCASVRSGIDFESRTRKSAARRIATPSKQKKQKNKTIEQKVQGKDVWQERNKSQDHRVR